MAEEHRREQTKEDIAREAEKRRHEIENPQQNDSDTEPDTFNPVEGVRPGPG